jgi:integrase/recombinase XerD
LVVESVASPHSRRTYRSGLEQFFAWWQETADQEPFGRALVQRYRSHLETRGCAQATINRQLAPVRKLADEAALTGLLPSAVASDVRRVKGAKRLGVRTGNRLAREQAQQLLALPDRNSLSGKRDAALVSLLLGAGLRRGELAQLRIEVLQQRQGRWCLVDLEGKGKRIRTVPIPAWTKEAVDAWLEAVPFPSGLVLGKVNKGGRFVGQGMTAAAI